MKGLPQRPLARRETVCECRLHFEAEVAPGVRTEVKVSRVEIRGDRDWEEVKPHIVGTFRPREFGVAEPTDPFRIQQIYVRQLAQLAGRDDRDLPLAEQGIPAGLFSSRRRHAGVYMDIGPPDLFSMFVINIGSAPRLFSAVLRGDALLAMVKVS